MRRTAVKAAGVVAFVVGAGVLVLSCKSGTPSATNVGPVAEYTGKLTDSDAFIAVVAGKADIVVWVGDGPHNIGVRFTGPRVGSGFDITLPIGIRAAGIIQAGKAAGAVTFGTAAPHPFTAALATGAAGLYSTVTTVGGSQVGLAWVVLNNGEQRGARIAGSTITDAPRLDVSRRTASLDGNQVAVAKINPTGRSGVGFGGGFGGQLGGQLGQTGQFGGQGGFGGGGFNVFGGQLGQGGALGGQGGQFGGQGGVGGKFGFGG